MDSELFSIPQFSIQNEVKRSLLLKELNSLTNIHYRSCLAYKNILDNLGFSENKSFNSIQEFPFIPVSLFKTKTLKSISEDKIFKILTSSGTTGQRRANIFLDKETSMLQTKALASIVTSYIGNKRLPMIIVDSNKHINNRALIDARGAGFIGLANFGRDHFFALDENMELKLKELTTYINRYKNEKILIFGFTFMIWQYLLRKIKTLGLEINLNNAVLLHGGGWKKLEEQSVSNGQFKSELKAYFGLKMIYNFYGMAEQTGSIYMECENGFFHAPNYSEILIRDFHNWSCITSGETGIVQTLSIIPKSYPGHSLLTEDLGMIIGIDDCTCGRKGTYFKITGRIPKAELRGCSDTHTEDIISERT